MLLNSLSQSSRVFYKYFLHWLNCSSATQDLANIPPTLDKHSHRPLVCKCSFQKNVSNSTPMTSSISIKCAVRPPWWGHVFVTAAPPSFGSFLRVFFCHTNVQDHFQRFRRTREGGGVNWEMAKLVLLAELCSVLQLWQKGNEWRERQTDNPLLETELRRAHNLPCAAGLLSSAGKQWAWMNADGDFYPTSMVSASQLLMEQARMVGVLPRSPWRLLSVSL